LNFLKIKLERSSFELILNNFNKAFLSIKIKKEEIWTEKKKAYSFPLLKEFYFTK